MDVPGAGEAIAPVKTRSHPPLQREIRTPVPKFLSPLPFALDFAPFAPNHRRAPNLNLGLDLDHTLKRLPTT